MTIEEYLKKVGSMVDDQYGKYFRSRFKDTRGTSELAMLASPSKDEYDQLKRAVAIMTPAEKANAALLTDEQAKKIAEDARIDAGILLIFLNGYALELKKLKNEN